MKTRKNWFAEFGSATNPREGIVYDIHPDVAEALIAAIRNQANVQGPHHAQDFADLTATIAQTSRVIQHLEVFRELAIAAADSTSPHADRQAIAIAATMPPSRLYRLLERHGRPRNRKAPTAPRKDTTMTDMIAADLTDYLRAARTYLINNDPGAPYLLNALRNCGPANGDRYLINEILTTRDEDRDWANDVEDRTREQVIERLAATEITTADLEITYGPNWAAIVRIIRQAASLTREQAQRLEAAQKESPGMTGREVRDIADTSVDEINPFNAVAKVVWAATPFAPDVAEAAALAEVLRDRLTPDQYDGLIAPWRTVFPAN